MMTLPPRPPSPPSGPPRGTYFSRRKLRQPLPPSPPMHSMVMRSTNTVCGPLDGAAERQEAREVQWESVGFGGNHVDPPTIAIELHDAVG